VKEWQRQHKEPRPGVALISQGMTMRLLVGLIRVRGRRRRRITVALFSPQSDAPTPIGGPERRPKAHGDRAALPWPSPSPWRPWPRRSCDLPCTLAWSHPPACYRHESQAHLGRGERHDEPGQQRHQAQGRRRRPPAAGEAQPLHLHCLVCPLCPAHAHGHNTTTPMPMPTPH
jgi:hypothetical protein